MYYQNEPSSNRVYTRDNIATHWVPVYVNNVCIGFIDFMFKGNSLTDFTNLFSPNDSKKKMIRSLK